MPAALMIGRQKSDDLGSGQSHMSMIIAINLRTKTYGLDYRVLFNNTLRQHKIFLFTNATSSEHLLNLVKEIQEDCKKYSAKYDDVIPSGWFKIIYEDDEYNSLRDKFTHLKSQFAFVQLMTLKPSSENERGYIYDGTITKVSDDSMFN